MSALDWLGAARDLWPMLLAAATIAIGYVKLKAREEARDEVVKKLVGDLNGLGGKVGNLQTQLALADQAAGQQALAHVKLEAEYRASQKELPDQLKAARHEVIAHLAGSIQGMDERVDGLRDDVRDLRKGPRA